MRAGHEQRAVLARYADRPLLLEPQGEQRTGRQLGDRTAALAGFLAARGLRQQRIGLAFGNGLAAFEAFLAVEWLGATRVPVDPGVPAAEANAIFAAAGVDLVLADEAHAEGLVGDVLTHDDEVPLAGPAWVEEPVVDDEAVLVVYPRQVAGGELFAVSTSYGNWEAIMRINRELFRSGWYGSGFDDTEMLLTMQQLMHGTGMVASFPFLSMGLPQVVLPRFDADAALEAIGRHRVTATFAVPGMLSRMADRVEPTTQLPLKHTLYGGAPLEPAELRRIRLALGPSLVQLYGRFEAGWPLAVLGTDEHEQILAGDGELATSCGRFIEQVEVQFGPAPGRPDGHGELQTRNPMVAPEYADPAGWCALGDVAYLDARGYAHLEGRLDGMINTGSYHVYPAQVVEAIEAVPGVREARVEGEPDPVWGEVVAAYLVPEDPDGDWEQLLADLRDELPHRLARYKIPRRYHRVTGKAAH